jgi:hypothetical protein
MAIIISVGYILLLYSYGLRLPGPSRDPDYWGPNYLGATVSIILTRSPSGLGVQVTCDEVTISSRAVQTDAGGNSYSILLVFVEIIA